MKQFFFCVFFLCFPFLSNSQNSLPYFEKYISFPSEATLDEKINLAAHLVPTPQQLEWQQMELTAFFHFGINTFTGNEWGDGKETPLAFNPTSLDADQWVKTLKDAGFKMAILTAKHHDGFCLWSTETTTHSVASSPWMNGKGDVVKDLRTACDKYGVKFGVYLSPWDRNASCYGTPEYNAFFVKQLTELLTNYGEVHEVWFDGANGEGPNGKKQVYDWEKFYATIKRLQPKAVMAIMGDDVRWVGNEKGLGRETEWSATALTPGIYDRSGQQNKQLGVFSKAHDLGSRDILKNANELFWYPSEVDVSIRPGWFYHASEDNQVKSLAHLVDVYFKSVGYNSVLLLNIPPDKRGLIHENDVKRLNELAIYLSKAFDEDYVTGGDEKWTTKIQNTKVYELKSNSKINTLLIQEDIAKGQRVENFIFEAWINSQWQEIAAGTTIGYKRLLRIADCKTNKLRVTISESRCDANMLKVAAYYAEPLIDESADIKLNHTSTANWKLLSPDDAKTSIIDNNLATTWKSRDLSPIVIDMGKTLPIVGFTYAPVITEDKSGTIFTYNLHTSLDGMHWTRCNILGEFSNIMHNPIPQFVRFNKKIDARYIKFEPLSEIENRNFITIAELGVLLE